MKKKSGHFYPNYPSFSGALLCLLCALAGCSWQEYKKGIVKDIELKRQTRYEAISRPNTDPNGGLPAVMAGQLSLNECVGLALKNNRDIQGALARLDESKGQITTAFSTTLPKLTLSASGIAHNDEMSFSGDRTYQWQFAGRQPLYLGGQAHAAIDAAAVFDYRIEQELRLAVQKVHFTVRKFYIDVLLAASLESVAAESKRNAQENLRLVTAQYSAGSVMKFEVLRARVRLRAIEAEQILRHNEYVLAMASLFNEIGISQLSRAELSDGLVYEPVGLAEELCLQQAMKRRPDLLIGQANIRLAEDNIQSEKSATQPKVFFEGLYQQDYPGFFSSFLGGGNDWQRTSSAGIVMQWDLFDGFLTDGKVAQAKALLRQQKIALQKQEEKVQLDVTQAILNLQNGSEFVQSQQGNINDAAEALRLAQINFREGSVTSLDVITAETALTTAKADYTRAVHDYQMAVFNLSATMGIIGESPLPTVSGVGQIEKSVQ